MALARTLLRTSSAVTAFARQTERPWLQHGVPEVSVCPFASVRVYWTWFELPAASLMMWLKRSVSVALSQSKNTR